jgi:predicted LPLAT superfamily acyltransferase
LPAEWTELRERSNVVALTLMRWIATALGRRIARLVLHPVTLYFVLFGGAARRASTTYLEQLWGRTPRWLERYRHLHCFAATVLDRIYLLQGRYDDFDVVAVGAEHYEAVAQNGGGVLFVGAHVGSFEALRALGKYRRSLRVAMVMFEENARLINATLKAVAPRAELHVIGLGRVDSMLALRDWLDSGGVAGVLADRDLPRPAADGATSPGAAFNARGTAVELPFLGRPARFHDGVFRLAAVLRRPVVFMVGIYRGGNRYELRFLPVADFSRRGRGAGERAATTQAIRAALERYVEIVESVCREAPYNWFNYYDFWATSGPPSAVGTAAVPATHVGEAASARDHDARQERDAHA